MINIDQLLGQSSSRDPEVCAALMDQYYPYIYRLALSILNDAAEADDAAQETFVQATLHLDTYRPGTHLRSWLSKIAVNACRGMLRRRKAKERLQAALERLTLLARPSVTPEDACLRSERRTMLWGAVAALDEKHRLPVILRYTHDLSVPEIASILGIPEGTVYSRLHHAHRKLRARLGASFMESDPREGAEA